MVLLWPGLLVLLAGIPMLVIIYLWAWRLRRRNTLRYASLALIRPALPRRPSLRRYIPPALFMLGLATLIVAFTRPIWVDNGNTNLSTVILVIDVSTSMINTDLQPTHLTAAEDAALSFIQRQDTNTQIGIVAFSGEAHLILSPTTDQAALRSAMKSLMLGEGTAIGNGILAGLEAISHVDKQIEPPGKKAKNNNSVPATLSKGTSSPDMVILLTDGDNNCDRSCIPPFTAARIAAERGVQIFTIGFSANQFPTQTEDPESNQPGLALYNYLSAGSNYGIAEQTLKQIAIMTGGKYYTVTSSSEMQVVFDNLPTRPIVKHEVREISVIFTAFGTLFVTSAMLLSMHWHPLP